MQKNAPHSESSVVVIETVHGIRYEVRVRQGIATN